MEDLISVIVPIYNVERYIRKCLDSIILQTYKNLEIILVDDGSTDNSGRICDEFAIADTRIKIIHKVNGGQCSARNVGLDISTGKYIAFVDSDDWIDIDYYEKLLLQVKDNNLDCCISDRRIFNENYIEIYNTKFANDLSYIVNNVQDYFVEKFFMYTPSVCNKLYTKEIINSIRFKDIKQYGSEDFIFNFEVMFNMKRVGEVSGTYCNNLERNGSTARRYIQGAIQQNINLFNECVDIAKKNSLYDEEMEAILLYVFNFFYTRSINHIKKYCILNCTEILKKEIYGVYDSLKYISKKVLINKEIIKIFKRYGFHGLGILVTKIQYMCYMLPFRNLSLLCCKIIHKAN